jgi:hypothetical protein
MIASLPTHKELVSRFQQAPHLLLEPFSEQIVLLAKVSEWHQGSCKPFHLPLDQYTLTFHYLKDLEVENQKVQRSYMEELVRDENTQRNIEWVGCNGETANGKVDGG